jgi:hypothetical protein
MVKKHLGAGIVHPNWTGDRKYHASYGSAAAYNRNNRHFSTLNAAKEYLRKHGITKADYENGQGNWRQTRIVPARRVAVQRRRPQYRTPSCAWRQRLPGAERQAEHCGVRRGRHGCQ